MIGGVKQGSAFIEARFQNLDARVPVTVVDPIPVAAVVTPLQTTALEVGAILPLVARAWLSDGSQQSDPPQVTLSVTGNSVQLESGGLARALTPGVSFVTAHLPAFPPLPIPLPTGAIVGLDVPADFFPIQYPRDATVVVVNQPLGLEFTFSEYPADFGSKLSYNQWGLAGVRAGGSSLRGSRGWVNLPRTGQLNTVAAGLFSGATTQYFFAGQRLNDAGSDYGVLLTEGANPTFVEFRDAPEGVTDAVVADFDKDGHTDAALVHGTELLVRRSRTGPLDTAQSYPLTQPVSQVATDDFNHDGRPDLVTAGGGGLQIWLAGADGGLTPQSLLPTNTPAAQHLITGDIDGDGNLDICYLFSRGQGTRDWLVAYGDGQGALTRPRTGTTGFRVAGGQLADFTGDGKADLVTGQSRSLQSLLSAPRSTSVSIHPGSSNGFTAQQVIPVSEDFSPTDLVLYDTDFDQRLDIRLAVTTGTSPATTQLLDVTRR